MKKQKVISQMKGQDKTPEKELNEMEIGNLPEKEFRKMIVNLLQDLRKRMEAKIEKVYPASTSAGNEHSWYLLETLPKMALILRVAELQNVLS